MARRPTTAVFVLLAVLVAARAATGDHHARLLHQEPPACANTESGRWHIADDRGMVCPRDQLNYATGCCTAGELHSCTSCDADDKCCSQYEHCVSCCLKPDNHPQQHIETIFRGRNKPETGRWGSPFEYCRAVCRTTARSTQHENAFILDRKHCFSKLGRPHVPVPPAPPLPKAVSMVAGGPGQNCDVACATKQLVCSAQHFASINDCNSLRAKFMCEAGCGDSAPDQKEFPGYVEGTAAKHQYPALCAALPPFSPQAPPAFNCSRGNGAVRRLCPCEPAPPGAQQAGAGATGGGADAATAAAQQGAAAGGAAAGQAAAGAQQQQAAAAAGGAQGGATQHQQQPAGDAGQQQAAGLQVGQQQQQQPGAGATA